ncbi:hypothetical protein [Candidatus Amarobacter glycogenicus]
MIHQAARITGISEENYRVKTLRLEPGPAGGAAGQFAMAWLQM